METYKIENGALIEVPAYEYHSRGKNWLAVIKLDPSQPGGINRIFLEKAKGDYLYMVSNLSQYDPVEFGADYYSSGGKKHPARIYGVVMSINSQELTFEKCSTPREAILLSQQKQQYIDKEALLKEKEQLEKRLTEINKLLEEK